MARVVNRLETLRELGPIGMRQVARIVAEYSGQEPNVATVNRWFHRGLVGPNGDRIKLEFTRIGSRVVTTRDAVIQFLNAQNATPGSPPPTSDAAVAASSELDALLATA